MSTIGRNTNRKVSEIRDYFLGAEEEFLSLLLKNENNIDKIYDYTKMPLELIIKKAKKLIEVMELGAFKDKNGKFIIINEEISAKIEKQLILLMASIDDVTLVNELEL